MTTDVAVQFSGDVEYPLSGTGHRECPQDHVCESWYGPLDRDRSAVVFSIPGCAVQAVIPSLRRTEQLNISNCARESVGLGRTQSLIVF